MSNNSVLVLLVPIVLYVILSTGLGIAGQIIGTIILRAAKLDGYTILTLDSANIGLRGGTAGYMIGVACCMACVAFLRIAQRAPIITVPFLIIAGAITGITGYTSLKRGQKDELSVEGFGSSHSVRAGAVGGAAVGGGVSICFMVGLLVWKGLGGNGDLSFRKNKGDQVKKDDEAGV